MDEPLSNLDAKLRSSMRAEIAEVQRKLEIATVYVTHDQTEAMTLGNRIAVLNNGRIEQIGSPREVYSEPSNVFVATFIGNPAMNLLKGRLRVDEGQQVVFNFSGNEMLLPDQEVGAWIRPLLGKEVILGVRPEHLKLIEDSELNSSKREVLSSVIRGTVVHVEPLGATTQIYMGIGAETSLVVSTEGYREYPIGAELSVGVSQDRIDFFDSRTGLRIADARAPGPRTT